MQRTPAPPRLSIRSWTEAFLPADEESSVAVAFDIFRCCTTIHTLFARREAPVYLAPSLKAVTEDPRLRKLRVFSELSQPAPAAERFDNSPALAARLPAGSKIPSLVATTTGTPSLFAARNFKRVYVGSLVNFSALVRHLTKLNARVTLIPAALPGQGQVEDEIVAYAMATALEGFADMPDFVRQCGEQAVDKILASPRPAELAGKLTTGAEDVRLALELDRYEQVLAVEFAPAPDPLARVIEA